MSRIRLISAATPSNLKSELARLEESFSRERGAEAHFEYGRAPAGMDELATALLRAADSVDGEGELGALYAGRARELSAEAMLCQSVGTPAFLHWARKRFARRDAFDGQADELAKAWLSEMVNNSDELEYDQIVSDDAQDERSLLSRMRKAAGERRLGVRVVAVEDLAPLSSVGEGTIYVAAGRRVSARDIERTVLHEIEGHALPLERAERAPLSLFKVGTARGSDDQEGRAIRLEEVHGFLDGRRKQELALRHTAARAVEDGAIFSDVVNILLNFCDDASAVLRIAARVCRGGGLAREVVYLPAYLRVKHAISRNGSIERALGAGRVSVDAAEALTPWIP